jgi:hypothetical protein
VGGVLEDVSDRTTCLRCAVVKSFLLFGYWNVIPSVCFGSHAFLPSERAMDGLDPHVDRPWAATSRNLTRNNSNDNFAVPILLGSQILQNVY